MPIFNADTSSQKTSINRYVERGIKAPYVYSQVSTLGGAARASVIVKVSLDPKSKWANGILQNSRYAMFYVGRNGVLEQFSGSHRLGKKMRRTTVKSLREAVEKINRYLAKVK